MNFVNQRGFSAIILLLGVLIASGLIIGGSFYVKNNLLIKKADENTAKNSQQTLNQSNYTNNLNKNSEIGNYSVMYFYRTGIAQENTKVSKTFISDILNQNKQEVSGLILNKPGIDISVSPDGKRFLMMPLIAPEAAPTQVHLVLNWLDELKRKLPQQ